MQSETDHAGVFSVSELTRKIQELIEERFQFVWVEGEISNFSTPASGHFYMVLKDPESQIRSVMFRMQARNLRFRPENGMHALARGRVSVYAPRGEYQLVLDHLEPLGAGALALAFEQTKKKLSAMGVFDTAAKRPLPFLPQRIAVVTSPTGAAIRDFLKIIEKRFANIEITVVPARVQGERAAEDLVRALELVNRELPCDVIVLTRGGGSMEDLQPFNEEALALAIRASRIPVVSAVGHEIDTTIADLAADMRAPTPTAAAQMLVAEKSALVNRLAEFAGRLKAAADFRISEGSRTLQSLSSRLRDPRRRMADHRLRLDELHGRMIHSVRMMMKHHRRRVEYERRALWSRSPVETVRECRRLLGYFSHLMTGAVKGVFEDARTSLSVLQGRIQDLSPMAVLDRGYSITRTLPARTIISGTWSVSTGDRVEVLLARGSMGCVVEEIKPAHKPPVRTRGKTGLT